jgi:transposase-like protein/transposase
MPTGRPHLFELTLSQTERAHLTALANARSLPYSHVRRAQIILASAAGATDTEIAARVGVSVQTVGHWRRRFHRHGLAGLSDAPRSGRPRTHDDERVARMLRTVLASKPKAGTHWSVRAVAAESGIAKSTVARYLALFGVQPHRSKSFTLSTDPLFVEKVRDIAGLYLNPPDHALVLCVDEKSQIQALRLAARERTQPAVPMGPGYVEGVTHGYVRHGTTTLFAALDISTGEVLAQCKRRHRHQEFLSFLGHIDASVPPDLDVHLVIDNYATHKHAAVRAWLAARPALPRALHAHVRVVAQPGRAVVRPRHAARDPARVVPHRARAGPAHRRLRAALQRRRPPVRLDGHRGLDPRQAPAPSASD